jgi:hypothetical protein
LPATLNLSNNNVSCGESTLSYQHLETKDDELDNEMDEIVKKAKTEQQLIAFASQSLKQSAMKTAPVQIITESDSYSDVEPSTSFAQMSCGQAKAVHPTYDGSVITLDTTTEAKTPTKNFKSLAGMLCHL